MSPFQKLCSLVVAIALTLCIVWVIGPDHASAEDAVEDNGQEIGPSGLPLPRFVSIGATKANSRAGPGYKYPIDWVYSRQGLPVEVIDEFDHWRRIRDHEGDVGWIHRQLLSGRRTALVRSQDGFLAATSQSGAETVAYLEAGVIGEVLSCLGKWCRLEVQGYRGWIRREALWGVYEGETIE